MNCDQTRINTIENTLQNNPESLSNNDLIYYLKCKSTNEELDEEYLLKINNSYIYENIFVNKSNYTNIVPLIIGLLIPFYYFYPRFYKIGFIACSIGFICLFGLYLSINNLYSSFFKNIGVCFFVLSFIIYVLFFIILNKLNHISLFFISAIISYLIINYILRVLLTLPFKNNKYNQYKATLNSKNPSTYTEYNVLLEKACYLVIERYKLKLPSGVMLYTYLSAFQIGDNSTKYTDCITTIFGPFISIIILWLAGYLLFLFEDKNLENETIKMFPIIGLNNDKNEYFTCQANYILPKELNMGLLIHECIDEYNFDENIYKKVEKALFRISKELLTKYNPLFQQNSNIHNIKQNIENNKIYIDIRKLLKKNNIIDSNVDNYYDKIKEVIQKENIPYKNKMDMYELLQHINNILIIKKDINENYNNDDALAKEELLYDKDIPDNIKKSLNTIVTTYINNFKANLGIINNKSNPNDNTKLYGYHYNIVTYSLFSDKVRKISNKLFKKLLRLISTWLLLAKPIGSSWLIVNYILISNTGFRKILSNLNSNFFLWKYFTMGYDKFYLEESYKKYKENKDQNNIVKTGLNMVYTILLFIFILPIIYMYNSITFGFTSSPLWYNLLYQFLFIINIIGNIICYHTKKSHLIFNIIFIIVSIIIMVLITAISYFIESKK